MIKKLAIIIFLNFFLILSVKAEKLIIFNFTEEELGDLKVRKVRGADA